MNIDIFAILANNWFPILFSAVAAYFLGSINFAIIVTKYFRKDDIRNHGSGNAGATNVLRSAGKLPAIVTLCGDLLKVVAAILTARMIFENFSNLPLDIFGPVPAYLAGLCCIIGHMFPCYFGFKGGKGVATTAGTMIFVDFRVFFAVFTVFLIVFLITHIVSISSVIGSALIPVAAFCCTYFFDYLPDSQMSSPTYPIELCWFSVLSSLVIAVIIIVKHTENIKRLFKGEEKKLF